MTARSEVRIANTEHVSVYKRILADVLDRRPSGTRQRLAAALGKNRSFVTQITNSTYPAPVPAQHLLAIFDACRFSPAERKAFLEAYHAAHPRRLLALTPAPATRRIAIDLPDLGDEKRNRDLENLLEDIARRFALIVRGSLRGET